MVPMEAFCGFTAIAVQNMTNSFEKNLEQLEEIVQSLEEGNGTLDDSLKAFEKGIKLSRSCRKELNKAERRVEVLLKEDGEIQGREKLEA